MEEEARARPGETRVRAFRVRGTDMGKSRVRYEIKTVGKTRLRVKSEATTLGDAFEFSRVTSETYKEDLVVIVRLRRQARPIGGGSSVRWAELKWDWVYDPTPCYGYLAGRQLKGRALKSEYFKRLGIH
jgi:hypothetical protein